MSPFNPLLHLFGSGATAYLLASQIRDAKTRPNVLAGFYFAESGSVPFLTKLRDRAQVEGDTWLADQLTHHVNDERRHGQVFANALKQHGKEPITPQASANKGSQQEKSPFMEAYFRGYAATDLQPENISWQTFLGSTHILEADACQDFRNLSRALTGVADMAQVRAGILSVATDEDRHASYLKTAMQRRYGYLVTESLITEWRSRKTDALLAAVGRYLQPDRPMQTLTRDRQTQPATTSPRSPAIAA
ncbi:MAG: ferritin-like domain-containing protein [Leptolyngbyaceae cyanobacterium]